MATSGEIPERLGKYPIVRVLGEGAMGVVYEAFDPVIRRQLAIKTIRRELMDGGDTGIAAAARFRNEAQAAGRLMHPGIAAVYEFGEDELCAFIAMEFVPGTSLREYLARRTRFAEQDVLSIMAQLLDALGHAHSQGVWHRDIKPANLMITREGRLKVTDFGVARIEAAGLTLDGSVIGTPGYMAPEQYSGEAIDRKVDIYAAGIVLYLLLAGRTPFSGSAESVMYRTMTEQPVPPSRVEGAAENCGHFDEIVLRALAKRAQDRFATAEEFRRALLDASGEPLSASVSEDTLIMEPAHPEPMGSSGGMSAGLRGSIARSGRIDAGPTGASKAFAGASDAATKLEGWDPGVLSRLEAELSRHVGPVAKVLVRRTAARCGDVPTLTAMLADQIPDETDRTAFMTATARATGARAQTRAGTRLATVLGTPGAVAAATTSRPGQQAADEPLTPPFIEHATRVLAAHVGPIARVVVRKAAERASGRRAFCESVVAACGEIDRPEAVVAELMRGPR